MKWLISLLFLCLPVRAEKLPDNWISDGPKHGWGGINLLQDSTVLDSDAQQAINVITDSGYLEKRPGNLLLTTISSGSAINYVTEWVAPSGTRYLIAQASTTIYQTSLAGAPTVLTTMTANGILTAVPAFSRLEFADGLRNLWYWNSVSTVVATNGGSGLQAPVCAYIAFKDLRIWCALIEGTGFTGSPSNSVPGGGAYTVWLSSSGGDSYWDVPYNVNTIDNAPNRFDFTPDDGEAITCMQTTPWGMFIAKRDSSYIVKGNGNVTYDPRILDPKIGCVDNRSVQMVYGELIWLAVDGVYKYNGAGQPQLISRELDPLVKVIREASYSQGQWLTTLQPDWASGTTSSTTGNLPLNSWNSSSVAGEIFPSSFTLYDVNNTLVQGTGFYSDTLINIDTTSASGNLGYVQLGLTTAPINGVLSGNYIWLSTFSNGGSTYSTGKTTWTLSAGTYLFDTSHGGVWVQSQSAPASIYTTAGPPSVGSWQFTMACNANGSTLGQLTSCTTRAGGSIEGRFIFYQDVLGNYYSVQLSYDPTASKLRVSITKNLSGTISTLNFADYTISGPSAANYYTSTFTVTRDILGNMNAYYWNFSSTISASDLTIPNPSVLQELDLYNYGGSAGLPEATGFYTGQYNQTGAITSRIFDSAMISPMAGVISSTFVLQGVAGETGISFYLRNSTSPNNDFWTSFQASSNSLQVPMPNRYWQYQALLNTTVSTKTPTLTSFQLPAISTGYYYSKVDFIGNNITSWRTFGLNEANLNTYNYAVRSATYVFLSSSTNIAWTAQSPNVTVAVATGAYAQFRLDSTNLVNNVSSASAAEPVISVALNWNNGNNIPVASSALERRYMLCVTISTAATVPDTCLIRQKSGKWVQWTGPSVAAMGTYNYQMIVGDGTSGSKVWQILQPNVYQDDGQPINASWISADFTGGGIFNPDIYYGTWVDAAAVQGSSVTFSYQADKSTITVSQTFSLDTGQPLQNASGVVSLLESGSINKWLPPVVGTVTGKYFRFQFSDATLNSYFRINNFSNLFVEMPMVFP